MEHFFECNPDMKDKIEFTGVISDRQSLAEEFAGAKIFVIASDWESFGLVTIEAMSQGCYIVGTDIKSTREITAGTGFASLFSCGDTDALGKALCKAAENDELLDRTRDEAAKYAEENYAWKASLSAVAEWIGKQG